MPVRDLTTLGDTAMANAMLADGLALEPGDLFRGLKIRALLGAGAMGTAYLASHAHMRMPVVIKLFRRSGGDPLAEAHLAARVVSAAVVPVLDAGIEAGTPYVIQRYVDGIDLDELLRIHVDCGREIPVPTLIRIGVSIFSGLAAIHTAGVIHRDIKPPNLFLAGSGDALVGDFGIAVDPNAATPGEVAGTPMFIAPEIWAGGAATARSDLYSAAATLHLLWQHEPPFRAANHAELPRLVAEKPYTPPASSDPTAAYFGAVLGCLLNKDPAARPESALGAARMLQRIASPAPELRGHADNISRVGDLVITVEQRDITTAKTDVIVCAANEQLAMRRSVANAIREAGGDDIEVAAMSQGPITMGQVVWTGPGKLACKAIAHAAAASDGAICIQRATLRTLFDTERRGHASITFPALGTSQGGVPFGLGARLMLEAFRTFAAFVPQRCRSIRVAVRTDEAVAAWSKALIALDAETSAR